MRIGMLLDRDYPPDPRVENEALSLLKAGYKVNLFCLNYDNQDAIENVNGIQIYKYGIPNIVYKKLSPLVYTLPFYSLILKRGILRYINQYKFDILHVHDMVIAGAVFSLSNKCGLPVVLDLHENRPEIMKTYTHVTHGIGRYLININKWNIMYSEFIRKASRVIVVTEEAKTDIVNKLHTLKDNVVVVPNTVNIETFLKYPDMPEISEKYSDKFIVLYIGNTGLRRGLEIAIKGIALVNNMINNILLVIVGSSRDDKKLKQLVEWYRCKNNVVFEGWQCESSLPSYIKLSDVCISPLLRNRHHDTTYANKIFQYMCFGKPILVSDCTAQKNIVCETECGLVYKANSSESFAKQLTVLYNKTDLRLRMGNKGRKAVLNKYNWEKTSCSLINMYNNLKISK